MANGVKQGGVISPIFFSLYIDPLLEYLRISGYGCHMKGVYIGAFSYTDDITISSPSIGGLNEMLKICHIFAEKNSILFNSKKTVCIKFAVIVVRNEEAYLNSQPLLWMDKVRHLGNIIDKDYNEVYYCTFKKSMFIGYVNKLRSNFGKMQPSVIAIYLKHIVVLFMARNYGNLILVDLIKFANHGILPLD